MNATTSNSTAALETTANGGIIHSDAPGLAHHDKSKTYFAHKVENWKVMFLGRSKLGPDLHAWLFLYGKANPTGVVGTIGFYRAARLPMQEDRVDGFDRPQGNMDASDLVAVLDMLREGSDVYVHWSPTWKQVLLTSEPRPLSEAEVAMLATHF